MFLRNTNNKEEERIAWLQLARTPGLGYRNICQLLKAYGPPSEVIKAQKNSSNSRFKKFHITERSVVEAELCAVEKYGAEIMMGCDADFPQALQAIDDPPLTITWRGNKQLLTQPIIAIVGARNASLAGTQIAGNFANDLAQQGIVIASGLARGIDTAAHAQAIPYKRTIAVIAGGISHIYPRENQHLFAQIAEDGLLMTEAAFGNTPQAQQFPRRNRLIAGLALGVVVIEAGLRSGSLSTANFALQQGRELFVVPGSPLDPRSQGCNLLIKRGAYLVENADDILAALPLLQTVIKPNLPTECIQMQSIEPPVSEVASGIRQLLSKQPVAIADIANHMQIPINLVNQAIVELELAGYAEEKLGIW